MNNDTIEWIYKKRGDGIAEDEIRQSLEASGWNVEQIKLMMEAPKPTVKTKNPRRIKLLLFTASGVFMILVFLLILMSMGVIGTKRIAFTPEKCLSLELPEGACNALQSMITREEIGNWLAPSTIVTLDGEAAESLFPTTGEIKLNLDSWVQSELANINSATICGTIADDIYVFLLSDSTGGWLLDATFLLNEFGTTTLSRDVSYCLDKA